MSDEFRMVTVDASNVEEERFFCYKSKPKSDGYQNKLNWLNARFAEGLRIRIVYEDQCPYRPDAVNQAVEAFVQRSATGY